MPVGLTGPSEAEFRVLARTQAQTCPSWVVKRVQLPAKMPPGLLTSQQTAQILPSQLGNSMLGTMALEANRSLLGLPKKWGKTHGHRELGETSWGRQSCPAAQPCGNISSRALLSPLLLSSVLCWILFCSGSRVTKPVDLGLGVGRSGPLPALLCFGDRGVCHSRSLLDCYLPLLSAQYSLAQTPDLAGGMKSWGMGHGANSWWGRLAWSLSHANPGHFLAGGW